MAPRKGSKRKQAEIMDLSHSDSSTNHNNQSDSWKCPFYMKKHSFPDATMISSRRASLRSARTRRLIETGQISASKCSQPQKSREYSSGSHLFQLDDPVDTVSEYQAPARSLVEYPPRHLSPVAHPSTSAQKMRHEETTKVGNSVTQERFTVNIEMEKACEDEMSMPNYSNKIDGQNAFELEYFPQKLKERLVEDIQASSNIEERSNKNHNKSVSMVGHPSPSFSHKLTEMINMLDDDDEVNSVRQSSPMDTDEGYHVKPESMPILRKILSKHGDIFKNCTVLSMKYRSMLLEMTCDIISELEEKDFGKIKEDYLQNMITAVNEMRNIKVDIEWLHLRLFQMLEARQVLKQYGMLKEEKESNRKIIDVVKTQLEECEAQKKEVETKLRSICDKESVCNETLTRAKDESTRITAAITHAKSKARALLCSLADGLL
ncbi:Phospholipase-like [Sesbania bispinosa]|nr:Phospholipase-like [Sesbania bispinosa]